MTVLATPEVDWAVTRRLAEASRIAREAVKDKTYQLTPVGAVVARYLRWKGDEWGATPDTLRGYEAVLAKLAIDYADTVDLAPFDGHPGTERLRDFMSRHWGETAPGTRRKNLSVLKDFFRWVTYDQRLVEHDPTVPIRAPRRRQPDRKLFTSQERRLLCDAAPVGSNTRCAVELLFGFGIRKDSLQHIQLGDYTAETGLLKIRAKGGKRQTLPADGWLRAVLDQHWEQRQLEAEISGRAWPLEYLLYPGRDVPTNRRDGAQTVRWEDRMRPMGEGTLHKWWQNLVEAAGVQYRSMHSARHTRLTEVTRSGKAGLKHAQLLAGHASIQTTADIYAHLDVDDLAEALHLLAEKRAREDEHGL